MVDGLLVVPGELLDSQQPSCHVAVVSQLCVEYVARDAEFDFRQNRVLGIDANTLRRRIQREIKVFLLPGNLNNSINGPFLVKNRTVNGKLNNSTFWFTSWVCC